MTDALARRICKGTSDGNDTFTTTPGPPRNGGHDRLAARNGHTRTFGELSIRYLRVADLPGGHGQLTATVHTSWSVVFTGGGVLVVTTTAATVNILVSQGRLSAVAWFAYQHGGLLVRDQRIVELLAAGYSSAAIGPQLSPPMARRSVDDAARRIKAGRPPRDCVRRETVDSAILDLVAAGGLTYEQIAARVGRTKRTIERVTQRDRRSKSLT